MLVASVAGSSSFNDVLGRRTGMANCLIQWGDWDCALRMLSGDGMRESDVFKERQSQRGDDAVFFHPCRGGKPCSRPYSTHEFVSSCSTRPVGR